jgi:glycosyltransferase involved in cell wall biosynthesis
LSQVPLRIAYVCYWNALENDGVVNKIDSVVRAWHAAGHEADVFCLTSSEGDRPGWNVFPFRGLRGRYRATQALQLAVLEYAPQVAYLRYDRFLPPLGRLMRRIPTVLEVQSRDREEAPLRSLRACCSRAYLELNRRALFSRAAGVVYVARELSRLRRFTRFEKPALVIGNGVDLEAVHELPAPASDGLRLAFLGSSGQSWQGIDKILRLAEQLADVQFDLIGYGPADLPAAPPGNVTAHGVLSSEQFVPILAAADAGIGTLALHRKNMEETCPLKVREYLGHGLPVVIAYEDTDLGDLDAWYILRLPNTESNVDEHAEGIRRFVESVKGRRVPHAEIEDRIGLRAKEATRLEFLARVGDAHAGGLAVEAGAALIVREGA